MDPHSSFRKLRSSAPFTQIQDIARSMEHLRELDVYSFWATEDNSDGQSLSNTME